MECEEGRAESKTVSKPSCGADTREVRDAVLRKTREFLANPDALNIYSLEQGESIVVTTKNSTYRIIMLDRTHQMVLIRGGSHFQQPTEACLLGSSRGNKIQIGAIVLGKGLGIAVGTRCFLTSPVTAIERQFLEKTGTE